MSETTTVTGVIVPEGYEVQVMREDRLQQLVNSIKAKAYEMEMMDSLVVSEASALMIDGPDAYKQGFGLLESLGDIETRVTTHYKPFKIPLQVLRSTISDLEKPLIDQVGKVKQDLSKRLGSWKAEDDRRAKAEAEKEQREADERARQEQQEKADVFSRMAEFEPDEGLAATFRQEAATVAAMPVRGKAIAPKTTAPPIHGGGHVREKHKAQIENLRQLMNAWIRGSCVLPEEKLIDALLPYLHKQAADLGPQISAAYPGVVAVPDHSAVAPRRRKLPTTR